VSDDAITAAEAKTALRIIDGLSESKRHALMLVDIAGLTAQEAADVLGCPRGTILAQVHRARRQVAAAMERQGSRR
jgi:RNA polymerase sigma-70 factor (ECF subfamily)